ncbi:unnamed protein product [Spodoptera littoralis]|uniref:E3 ubiquitin-protein ligase n=1 Tax=Spodoptera littoralis TaxID=7109 RepID=A0A9P0N5T6_SPOLI|nr:unnamed protein product [Spodoptera littoralis]CAH1640936.1 unnamed protein product [Spodoptera littoralis]
MGNNQSENNRPTQPHMNLSDLEHILNTQRQRYEQKLQDELAKQRAQQLREQEAKERRAKEQEAREKLAKEQAKQRAEQSSNSSNTVPSNSVGGPQQQAAVIVPPQQLYPTLTQTPNYPVHVNQPHPLIQTNPFQQPNPMFQHYPQFNPPQPWNPPQHVNHPRNQPNSYQNRATPTPPPQDFVFVNAPGQRYKPVPSAPVEPSGPSTRPRIPDVVPSHGPRNRSRSTSRARPVNKNRGIYDCPTCNQRYGLKIFQCPNGHSACNDCKIRGRACAICGLSLTGVRNFEVENHVAQTPTTCPNKNEGCNSMIKQINMDKHLESCPYMEQQCPLVAIFGTCRWKGKLSQLSTHFDEMHSSNRGVDVDKEIYLRDIHNSSRQVHLVVIGGYNFLCHLQVSETDGKIFMAVQLLGINTAAKKWTYEIHVYKKSEPRRKYMYSDTCVSSKEEVFKSGKCAVLPIFYAATFVDREGMAFKFFIQKISNKNNEDDNQDDQLEEERENMNGNDTDESQRPQVENWRESCTTTESRVNDNQHYQRPRSWVNQRRALTYVCVNTGNTRNSVEVENWRASSDSRAQSARNTTQRPNKHN